MRCERRAASVDGCAGVLAISADSSACAGRPLSGVRCGNDEQVQHSFRQRDGSIAAPPPPKRTNYPGCHQLAGTGGRCGWAVSGDFFIASNQSTRFMWPLGWILLLYFLFCIQVRQGQERKAKPTRPHLTPRDTPPDPMRPHGTLPDPMAAPSN